MGQESWHPRDYKGYSAQMERETGGGSGKYGIQVEGRNKGTEVENWDQFQRRRFTGHRGANGSATLCPVGQSPLSNGPA